MAPERIVNPADVDARSDIYALGAVGYYLLTGKPIFDGDDNLEISNQVLHAPAPRASASGVAGDPGGRSTRSSPRASKRTAPRRPQIADAVIEALDRRQQRGSRGRRPTPRRGGRVTARRRRPRLPPSCRR